MSNFDTLEKSSSFDADCTITGTRELIPLRYRVMEAVP